MVKHRAKMTDGAATGHAEQRTPNSKMIAFALLLAVPAALTGCTTSRSDCNPDYEACADNGGGGGYVYSGGGSSSKSGTYRSSDSVSGFYKGFGSGGKSGIGG